MREGVVAKVETPDTARTKNPYSAAILTKGTAETFRVLSLRRINDFYDIFIQGDPLSSRSTRTVTR